MSFSISPTPRRQFLDINGNPASGYQLFTYAAGSTTKQATYTDPNGNTANTNPIILDSEGRTPYEVWYTDGLAYKEVLASPTDTDPPTSGVLMGDNLLGSGANTSTASQWVTSGITPTYISASSFSMAGDQTTELHAGRRVKCTVSAGTVYGFIVSSVYASLTTVTVQLDSGVLDSGLSAVELGVLTVTNHAIPDVPRVYNAVNDIINGQFLIAQAGSSFAAVVNGAYDLDGWRAGYVSSAVMTISQDSSVYRNARKVLFTTADAAIAAGDYIFQQTRIEGYDALKYIGEDFTIGFYVQSSVVGVHCVAILDGTNTYVSEYTINTANTLEYKTITILGGLSVLLSYSNGYGFAIAWTNACGATWQTTADAWQVGDFFGTSNQVNDAATINNTFYLANVTLNLGTTATKNDIPVSAEFIRCQRYYETGTFGLDGYIGGATSFGARVSFKVTKRAAPTITQTNTGVVNCSTTTNNNTVGQNEFVTYRTGTGAGAIAFFETWTAAARL